jgi:hypothetical protein
VECVRVLLHPLEAGGGRILHSQGALHAGRGGSLHEHPDQLARGAVHQLAIELLLALEVLVDERLRDPRSGGHVIDPDVLEAMLPEHVIGRVQDALPPLLSTQPPPWPLRSLHAAAHRLKFSHSHWSCKDL